MSENEIARIVVNSALNVHRALGPGLLESAYHACLRYELTARKLVVASEVPLPVRYKAVRLDCGYRIDMLVEEKVILELKACETTEPVHFSQLLTYLRLTDKKLGLLINFNVPLIKNGIHRVVNGL